MKAMSRRRWLRVFVLSLLLFPFLTAAQCISKAKDITIDIPPFDQSLEFDVDIDALVAKKGVKADADGKLPAQSPEVTIPFDVAEEVDFSDDANVKKYGSKISYVKVELITVTPVTNSVNVDLPTLQIQMSERGKDNYQTVGTLDSIKAGATNTQNLVSDAAGKAHLEAMLLKFGFNLKAKAAFVLKPGMPIPKGKLKLKVRLKFQLGVSPFK
jgi:hypothetical protein